MQPASRSRADLTVLSAERRGDRISFRLESAERAARGPLQEVIAQRLDDATLRDFLDALDGLLRGPGGPRAVDEVRTRGALLYRALVPERLRAELRAIAGGPLLVSTSLFGVPWELLHDGDDFWGVRYALGKQLVLERALPTVAARDSSRTPRVLVIGSDSLGDLPFVQDEIERICAALAPFGDVSCLGGPAATFDAVTAALGRSFDLVHFCGHVVRADAGGPGLLLAERRPLPASAIEASVRGQPLVFLNGCASVRGGAGDPRGIWEESFSSVAHGFLFGGAVAVVGTLCDVSDARAVTVAEAFWRAALGGAPIGEALRRGRLECRRTSPDSLAWLSFALYGNPARAIGVGRDEPATPPAPVAVPVLLRRRRPAAVFGLTLLMAAGLAYQLLGAHGWRAGNAPPVVVGVMDFRARGEVPDWMREIARDGLNTILSKVLTLRVYSRQKIDFVRAKRGLDDIEAAEALGIGKMISGTVTLTRATVTLEAEVVDIGTGLLEASERVSGPTGHLIELQNRLAIDVLAALGVRLGPEDVERLFAKRTNETLEAYRLLAETFGGEAEEPAPVPPPEPGSRWDAPWPASAWAADRTADDGAIRALLEAYRAACEAEDVDRLAALYVNLGDAQRVALARYFGNAGGLRVRLTDLDLMIEGDDALATFTRQDVFVDAGSGREVQVEIRVSTVLVRAGDGWRIGGLRKP